MSSALPTKVIVEPTGVPAMNSRPLVLANDTLPWSATSVIRIGSDPPSMLDTVIAPPASVPSLSGTSGEVTRPVRPSTTGSRLIAGASSGRATGAVVSTAGDPGAGAESLGTTSAMPV